MFSHSCEPPCSVAPPATFAAKRARGSTRARTQTPAGGRTVQPYNGIRGAGSIILPGAPYSAAIPNSSIPGVGSRNAPGAVWCAPALGKFARAVASLPEIEYCACQQKRAGNRRLRRRGCRARPEALFRLFSILILRKEKPLMKEAVICSATRTPIGSFNGTLSPLKASDLGAIVLSLIHI